jgi:hypothetical protein
MTDIPSSIPFEIRVGDTTRWRRDFADYPASAGWSLAYTLIGSAGAQAFSAVADGDGFTITISAVDSSTWTAGSYTVTEYVTNGAERVTLNSVPVRVLADLAAATAAADLRTHARKVLDAIEAWLESKAPTSAGFEIAGRKLQNYPLADLLKLRDRYRAEVLREERAALGFGPVRILTRFS